MEAVEILSTLYTPGTVVTVLKNKGVYEREQNQGKYLF